MFFFLLLCCLANAPTSFSINTVAPQNINLIKTDISSGDYCPIFMVTEVKLLFFQEEDGKKHTFNIISRRFSIFHNIICSA